MFALFQKVGEIVRPGGRAVKQALCKLTPLHPVYCRYANRAWAFPMERLDAGAASAGDFLLYASCVYSTMRALFVELPMFARHRDRYLDEEEFRALQVLLLASPEAGDLMQGAGGLRKVRFTNQRRGKGKRGGLRVVYFWWESGAQFWLFTLFDKGEVSDLSNVERETLKGFVKNELEARRAR